MMEVELYFDETYNDDRAIPWSDVNAPRSREYFAEEYGDYITSWFNCPQCKGKTTYPTFEEAEAICPLYYCGGCEYYYFTCGECFDFDKKQDHIKLCRIVGHHNYANQIEKSDGSFEILTQDEGEELDWTGVDDGFIRYLDTRYHFDTRLTELTGPDGGFPVFLECEKCGELEFNDK